MREPKRILAIKKHGKWYATVSDENVCGGGSGDTSEIAIQQAHENFQQQTPIEISHQVARVFRLPSTRC